MIRDGLAIVGAGWLVVYFGGGLLGITNFLKGKIPSLAPKIDQVQERVIGGKVTPATPSPTPSILPATTEGQAKTQAREWDGLFYLRTPWTNFETRVGAGKPKEGVTK